jgi:DNA-binding MarR family transcriptional regulator
VAKPHRAPASARDERESDGAEPRAAAARGARPARGGRGALRSVAGRAADPAPLELDRLIHERLRLGIVSALAVNDSLSFTDLKSLMGTSDGNLSVHARKLEHAGYVACTKSFDGRVPRTEYRITPSGRAALERYLDHMEALIRATRER